MRGRGGEKISWLCVCVCVCGGVALPAFFSTVGGVYPSFPLSLYFLISLSLPLFGFFYLSLPFSYFLSLPPSLPLKATPHYVSDPLYLNFYYLHVNRRKCHPSTISRS